MFSVSVRDRFMIAHSFHGETFGPAQALHGATFVVDAELSRPDLDHDNVVTDIGRFLELLAETLKTFNYKNLDELPEFKGQNTTTEFLAKAIFDRLASAIAEGRLGKGSDQLSSLKVTLHESDVAKAAYEGPLAGAR